MSFKIENNDTLALHNPSRPQELGTSASAPQEAASNPGTLSLPPTVENAPRSPELESLTAMMNLRASSATLGLALAEVIESFRSTNNVVARNKIDQLMDNKLGLLKDKQRRLELAQKKFDEAQSSSWWTNLWPKIRFGISAVITTVAAAALISTGIGSVLGVMLLAGMVVAVASTVNEGLVTFTGEGLGGRIAEAAGASKQTTMKWDMAVGIVLAVTAVVVMLPATGGSDCTRNHTADPISG